VFQEALMSLEVETNAGGANLAPSRRMRAKFLREVDAAGLPRAPHEPVFVTERDLAGLPNAALRYLGFMGVSLRPRTWSFRLHSVGKFRLAPERPWMACEAWQYNSALSVARIFHMRLRFGGVVPMLVRDTYVRGRGRMRGRVWDAYSIVDESNEKIDTGELVTYLNDAILFAPAMLLGPMATFGEVDERAFDVTLRDSGRAVSARVFVDERGAVTDFSTVDRFGADPTQPNEMIRARWSTPIGGWKMVSGRPVPTGGTAIWHFPSGDFAYADFRFGALEFDVPPHV
jgi:hypothetical protein